MGGTDIRVCHSGHSCPACRAGKNAHTRQTGMSVLPEQNQASRILRANAVRHTLHLSSKTTDKIGMVVVRPVTSADLDQLEALAGLTGVGLTTLPKDRDYLAK